MPIGLKVRFSCLAAAIAVAPFASANTQTGWSNPLLRDVPASAKAFISVDLAGTNKALASVLKLVEGVGGNGVAQVAAGALGMLNLPKAVQDAFAKSTSSQAVIYFDQGAGGAGMQQSLVLVLGLKPGNPMAAALKSATQHDVDGISYADFKDVAAHLEGDTLLLTTSPKNLPGAVKPLRGGAHLSAKDLGHISDSIEPTAEVIGWMDSDTVMSATPSVSPAVGLTTAKSFGFSLGLHAKGLSLSVGLLEFSIGGKPLNLATFRPLPDQYMHTLPGGAYLLACVANPWPLMDKLNVMGQAGDDVKKVLDGIKGSIRGNYVFGIYPTRMKDNSPEGIDLLMELRPNEGNDPAANLHKLMSAVQKSFLPGDINVFESIKIPGAEHAYRLNRFVASMLRAAMKMGLGKVGGAPDSLLKEKNLVFAGVGTNILVATSEPVLRKAVAALKFGSNALAFDPKYAELARDGAKPTHFVLAVSLTRTLTFVAKMLTASDGKGGAKSMAPAGVPIAMLTGFLTAWPDPLMLRLSIQHNGLSGRIFLPIDFETLAMFGQAGIKPTGKIPPR